MSLFGSGKFRKERSLRPFKDLFFFLCTTMGNDLCSGRRPSVTGNKSALIRWKNDRDEDIFVPRTENTETISNPRKSNVKTKSVETRSTTTPTTLPTPSRSSPTLTTPSRTSPTLTTPLQSPPILPTPSRSPPTIPESKGLNDLFEEKADYVTKNVGDFSNEDLLDLYGFFKQAKFGDNDTNCPVFWKYAAKRKWEAWKSRTGLSSDAAKKRYIEKVEKLIP